MAQKGNKEANKHRKSQQVNVHPVLEAGVIFVKIIVLFTAGLVLALSVQAGAEWYDIAFRTALAMIVVGLLGWYANWMLGKWIVTYETNKLLNDDDGTLKDMS
jgi:hypothetical protein